MPIQLPTYQSRGAQPTQAGGVRVNPAALAAPAEAAAQFGQQITATATYVGVEARRQQERNEAVTAAKQAVETEADWSQRLAKAKEGAPDGAPDFTKSVLEQFAEDKKARLAAAPETARGYLDLQLTRLGTSIQAKATDFEATARMTKQTREVGDIARLSANAVRSDDAALPQHVGTFTGAVMASSLSEPMKIEVLRQGREMLSVSAVQGRIERDPAAALAELGKGIFDGDLSPQTKDKLVNGAQAEIARRQQEAEQRRRMAEADHRAMVADLRVEAAAAETATRQGVAYSGLDDLIAKADKLDVKTAAGLRDAKADLGWHQKLLTLSPADQAAEVDRAREAAKATDNPAVAATLSVRAARGEQAMAEAARALKKDPLGYAEAVGTVTQTNFLGDIKAAGADEAKVKQAIDTRLRAVASAKERFGVDVPFLKPAEVDRLGTMFDSEDTAAKTAALATLARVPHADIRPVLQSWKDDKPDVVAAVGMSREAPHVAEAIVRGRTIRAQQPRALPAKEKDYLPALDESLDVLNARPDVRLQAEEAIKNVAADLAMRAGDLSADGTAVAAKERFKTATRMVLGNTVEWNGEKILPPARDMDQAQFRKLMVDLPAETKAFTAAGKPVSADAIRWYGKLEGVGQGQYRVKFNAGYAVDAEGKPFVLDLRGGPR